MSLSYPWYESFGKYIPSKNIPSGPGEPLKETKNMLKGENDKQVLYGWMRCLAFSSYVNMIGSLAKERHRFKFVQNRSKVFW